MSHEHPVIDTDTHFVIDENTRMVNSTNVAIPKIMQYDCDSERLSFRLPKTIDGHDMTLCNRVFVEYINTDGRAEKTGRYVVNDVSVAADNEEEIVFSWLISDKATQLNGNLNFVVVFLGVNAEGKITYRWATEIYKGLTVGEGLKNDDAIASEYADVLEKWYADVIATITEGGFVLTVNGQEPDENGNVEVVAGVQSDWNQNNPESLDYVKNRPFYEDNPKPLLIEFDGNIVDGMELIEMEAGTGAGFLKLSNDPLTAEELIGGEIVINMGGTTSPVAVTAEMVVVVSQQGISYIQVGDYVMSVLESFTMEGMSITRGLWTLYMPEQIHVQSLSFPSVVRSKVIPIPDKFFNADSIVAKGLGYWNGKLNDWTYILKKPFSAEPEDQEYFPSYTWDGDTSGKEIVSVKVDDNGDGYYFCKVDDIGVGNHFDFLFSSSGYETRLGYSYYGGEDYADEIDISESSKPKLLNFERNNSLGSKYALLGDFDIERTLLYLDCAGIIVGKTVTVEKYGCTINPGVYLSFIKKQGVVSTWTSRLYFYRINQISNVYLPKEIVLNEIILNSSSSDSSKKFRVTVDDTGALTAVEV